MNHLKPDAVLDAIVAATSHLVLERDPFAFFSNVLDQLVDLSGSEYGFVAEVRERDGQPYLASYAVTDISWDEATSEHYQRHARANMPLEFTKLDTLYGHVLRTREVLRTDAASTHPAAAGTPEGHPALTTFVGVPLVIDGDLIGMIALANRPGGYPESLYEELKPLFTAAGYLILAFKNRLERVARSEALELEKLTAEVAVQQNLDVVAHVSHDLRTPLNSVVGFAQLLAATDLTPRQRTHVERILTASSQMNALITDVLDIQLRDEARTDVSAKPTNVTAIVSAAAEQIARRAEISGVQLDCISSGPCIARVDPHKLHRIVDNLIANAVKYSDEGGRVTVTVRDLIETIEVEVTDTGLGIDEADLARIFDPFERITTEGRIVPGSGVGLAIVRRLCDLLHIDLTVASQPGRGSTFTIGIPTPAAIS